MHFSILISGLTADVKLASEEKNVMENVDVVDDWLQADHLDVGVVWQVEVIADERRLV